MGKMYVVDIMHPVVVATFFVVVYSISRRLLFHLNTSKNGATMINATHPCKIFGTKFCFPLSRGELTAGSVAGGDGVVN